MCAARMERGRRQRRRRARAMEFCLQSDRSAARAAGHTAIRQRDQRMNDITMTREIQVEDYPQWDASTEDGQEEFSNLAFTMKLREPHLCHFIFKRGREQIGEMYIRN